MTRDHGAAAGQPPDLVSALEADLAALAAADADLDRDAEVAERTRVERSRLVLGDRLRGARAVEVTVRGGVRHTGLVEEVGGDWVVLGHVPPGRRSPSTEHLVALSAVVAVRGLDRSVPVDTGPLAQRSSTSVLRGWCRDRSEVSVLLLDGSRVAGLASAAYADHLDVAAGGEVVTVPVWSIAVVSRPVLGPA